MTVHALHDSKNSGAWKMILTQTASAYHTNTHSHRYTLKRVCHIRFHNIFVNCHQCVYARSICNNSLLFIRICLVCLRLWWFLQCMKYHAWICIMHGNLKDIPKFSHSHISRSQWRNCEIIIDTGLLKYLNCTTQSFCKLFLAQLTRNWNIFDM